MAGVMSGWDTAAWFPILSMRAPTGYDASARAPHCEENESVTKQDAERVADASPDSASKPRGKTVDESRVVMASTMQPTDANVWGNVHGGTIMRLVDEAGGAVAIRHSRSRCVTVAMDTMVFKEPVYIGDLLTIRACLTYTGRTSMEVETQIEAEDLQTGQVRSAGASHLVYVAIDSQGRPTPVPPLILQTEDERQRWRAAEERRAFRARMESR